MSANIVLTSCSEISEAEQNRKIHVPSWWQWRNDYAQLRRHFAVQLLNEEGTATTRTTTTTKSQISPFSRSSEPFGDVYKHIHIKKHRIHTFKSMVALQSLFGYVYVPFLSSMQPIFLQQLTGGVVLLRSINSSSHWKMWCLLLLQKAMVRKCLPCATEDQQFGVKRRPWLWLSCLSNLCHDERWVCSRIVERYRIFAVNTDCWDILAIVLSIIACLCLLYLHFAQYSCMHIWIYIYILS